MLLSKDFGPTVKLTKVSYTTLDLSHLAEKVLSKVSCARLKLTTKSARALFDDSSEDEYRLGDHAAALLSQQIIHLKTKKGYSNEK